jgi:DNA-binding CsgD family transcriptional regulator
VIVLVAVAAVRLDQGAVGALDVLTGELKWLSVCRLIEAVTPAAQAQIGEDLADAVLAAGFFQFVSLTLYPFSSPEVRMSAAYRPALSERLVLMSDVPARTGVRPYRKVTVFTRMLAFGNLFATPALGDRSLRTVRIVMLRASDLTDRQVQVLTLVADGLATKQIARHLGISIRTVQDHLARIRQVTGARREGEMIARAVAAGLMTSNSLPLASAGRDRAVGLVTGPRQPFHETVVPGAQAMPPAPLGEARAGPSSACGPPQGFGEGISDDPLACLPPAPGGARCFARNVRAIEVLIDRDAITSGAAAAGTPWQYYDLGHGYCSYMFFEQCPHRIACARCDFYTLKAQVLEAKDNLQPMLASLPLTDDERAAVDDGQEALDQLLDRLADLPTPAGPTPSQIGRPPSVTLLPIAEIRQG